MRNAMVTRCRQSSDTKRVVLFFVLTFLFSWLCWLPSLMDANTPDFYQPLLLFGMLATWGPLVSALIVLALSEGKSGVKQLFKSAWSWKFNKKWLLAIMLLPIGMTGLALLFKLFIEDEPFAWGQPLSAWFFLAFAIFFTGGPLEEFGWRGYALPRMLRMVNPLVASMIIGTVHALWHLPLRYMPGTVQNSMPFWQFGLVTIVGAFLYTWIFLGTNGSLTAMIIFHWIGNMASAIFVYWDTNLGRWSFFIIQLIVVVIILVTHKKLFLSVKPDYLNKDR